MADTTQVVEITRQGTDNKLVLTLSFNGGPITVLVDEPSKSRQVYTFSADPFFRRNNHYIASGSLSLRLGGSTGGPIIVVSFSNMFPKDVEPQIDANFGLNLYLESNPTIPPEAKTGTIARDTTKHIVFIIKD
jgi:hypothetical protein